MKKMINPFKIVLTLLLLLQVNVFAQDNDNDNKNDNKKKYEFVKKKSVNKSYNVSSSDKLNIKNSFGSVQVHTWNRNEIKVDVEIEVSANTDALAQKIIDRISVSDEKNGKGISFTTDMKDIHNSKDDKRSRDEKSTMNINYTINMPEGNPLQIQNEFGSTTIPDFKGEVEVSSKFGSLTAGNLSNIKSINVEFGKATLANKFSKAVISKLSGAVKLNLEFCSNVRLSLDNNLTSLDLKTSYSTVNLKPLGNLQANYNISTSFGSFKNTSDVKFTSDEDKDDDNKYSPKFDHEYSGKSGSGSIPVKVKSSFGKIIVGEASEEDMKSKDKDKKKDKSKT
jgi:formylmethanofuran dehydrogenase subunit D